MEHAPWRPPNVSWIEGQAEKLPLPDGEATVAWAISSFHHWEDRGAGISEAWRILAPGGRLVLAERLARPGARGHAAHGLTQDRAEDLARQLTAARFGQVRQRTAKAGHRTLVIIRGAKDPAADLRRRIVAYLHSENLEPTGNADFSRSAWDRPDGRVRPGTRRRSARQSSGPGLPAHAGAGSGGPVPLARVSDGCQAKIQIKTAARASATARMPAHEL